MTTDNSVYVEFKKKKTSRLFRDTNKTLRLWMGKTKLITWGGVSGSRNREEHTGAFESINSSGGGMTNETSVCFTGFLFLIHCNYFINTLNFSR